MLPHVALYGRSGSGKTTIANHLVTKHGYCRLHVGGAVRKISLWLFGSEAKDITYQVTDAMRSIDENVWLRVVLSSAPSDCPLVLDSLRYNSEYDYLTDKGFVYWRVDAPLSMRSERLKERGQEWIPAVDDLHTSEVELEERYFSCHFSNDHPDVSKLFREIDSAISEISS